MSKSDAIHKIHDIKMKKAYTQAVIQSQLYDGLCEKLEKREQAKNEQEREERRAEVQRKYKEKQKYLKKIEKLKFEFMELKTKDQVELLNRFIKLIHID